LFPAVARRSVRATGIEPVMPEATVLQTASPPWGLARIGYPGYLISGATVSNLIPARLGDRAVWLPLHSGVLPWVPPCPSGLRDYEAVVASYC
jgi:hypothetical protein